MATKKQIDKDSLRRLMRQKKEEKVKKIEHPLARYNNVGQLCCIVCQTSIKSSVLWNAHLMSRLHKEHVENQQKQKEQKSVKRTTNSTLSHPSKSARIETPGSRSLPLGDYESSEDEEERKPAVQTASTSQKGLPSDFFSAGSGLKLKPRQKTAQTKEEKVEGNGEVDEKAEKKMSDVLPEGFFDDPLTDAQVRQVPYKSKIDEELESFQKAMKDMTQQSEAIIEEDDEKMDAERTLSSIDEQMARWKRVNQLELRQEEVQQPKHISPKVTVAPSVHVKKEEEESEEDEEVDPDNEALMWRSKRRL